MMDSNDRFKLIDFYESLNEDQKIQVERKFSLLFPPEKVKDICPVGDLYILRCTVAKDMFGKKILKG